MIHTNGRANVEAHKVGDKGHGVVFQGSKMQSHIEDLLQQWMFCLLRLIDRLLLHRASAGSNSCEVELMRDKILPRQMKMLRAMGELIGETKMIKEEVKMQIIWQETKHNFETQGKIEETFDLKAEWREKWERIHLMV